MDRHDLLTAIARCNESGAGICKGNYHAFLFLGYWYPMRLLVNQAARFSGEKLERDTNQAKVQVDRVLPEAIIAVKGFSRSTPTAATLAEVNAQIRRLLSGAAISRKLFRLFR